MERERGGEWWGPVGSRVKVRFLAGINGGWGHSLRWRLEDQVRGRAGVVFDIL